VLLGGERRLQVLDQTDVGAGASHVIGDEIAKPGEPAQVHGRGHAAGRAGQDGMHGQAGRHLCGHDPPAGGRDEHAAGVPLLGQGLAESGEIAADLGADVGIQGGRAEPLVLAELGQHPFRRADEPAGQELGGHARGHALVGRVRIAVKQGHDEGARTLAVRGSAHMLERGAHVVLAQRAEHRAVERQALVHLDHSFPRHQRRRLEGADVVEHRPVRASDLEGVAKPARGQHPHRRSAAFQDSVRPDGGAMHDAPRARERDSELAQGVEQSRPGIGGRGRRLPDLERPAALVVEHGVGEGPPHVDPHPLHVGLARHARLPRRTMVRRSVPSPILSRAL
jgi:hypothetical protein